MSLPGHGMPPPYIHAAHVDAAKSLEDPSVEPTEADWIHLVTFQEYLGLQERKN